MYSLPEESEDDGQFGLYGTSAALELLSNNSLGLSFFESPSEQLTDKVCKWSAQFLSTWNFVDLIVRHLGDVENSKFWNQSRNTLRVCNLLRAVASASQRLGAFAEEQKRIKTGCTEIGDDLDNRFNERSIKDIGRILHQRLLDAKVERSNIPAVIQSQHDEVTTFRFACDAKGVPRTIREWLFVWSSVIVALVRAYRRGVLDSNQVAEICTNSDIALIKNVLKDHETYEDAPYRLYALWALDHLNPNRYISTSGIVSATSNPEFHIPQQLALGAEDCTWLSKEIEETARSFFQSEVGLRDVITSYLVMFQDSNNIEKVVDVNDYFVIPVVPILFELIARYRPAWLLRPIVAPVLRSWLENSFLHDANGNLAVLPYQNSDYNGTVNAIYYREAALRIADAIDMVKPRSIYYVPWWYVRDELKVTPARIVGGTVLSIGVLLLWLYGTTSSIIVLILSGFLFPLVTNLWTEPVRKWLQKNFPSFKL